MYYKKNEGQISIAEFIFPFGKLSTDNRWVHIADMIPWERFEKKYAVQFCQDNGAPAIRFRMAMGTLLIKQMTGHSDEEVLQDIMENPYMQYLIGLHGFTEEAPFVSSSITNFRKYISQDMINEINEVIFRRGSPQDNDSSDNHDNTDNTAGGGKAGKETNGLEAPPNKGTLMQDATCAPAYLAYPTDISLLNEAREKLEGIIDTLHPHTGAKNKPRTYRKEAHKRYLWHIKQRRPGKGRIRKAIGQQLRYVARDIGHINEQLEKAPKEVLSNAQRQWLDTIKELYAQQQQMHGQKSHTVKNRIVSISQPHVRPIVRGKVNAPVEFGAKVTVNQIDGYAFIQKLGWEAYNEESQLIPAIEHYKQVNGCYPERVLVDKLYRNRTNRDYCKERGIRISGPRLGRPPKEKDKAVLAIERMDSADRNEIEGVFGQSKTNCGLDLIMARLMGSSETVIALAFLCMNIRRRLLLILRYFFKVLISFFDRYFAPSFCPRPILWGLLSMP
jgi:hypothetical protein